MNKEEEKMNTEVTENEQKIRLEKSKDAVGNTIEKGLPAKILIFNVEQLRAFSCLKMFHKIPSFLNEENVFI